MQFLIPSQSVILSEISSHSVIWSLILSQSVIRSSILSQSVIKCSSVNGWQACPTLVSILLTHKDKKPNTHLEPTAAVTRRYLLDLINFYPGLSIFEDNRSKQIQSLPLPHTSSSYFVWDPPLPSPWLLLFHHINKEPEMCMFIYQVPWSIYN